jgi:hypothetical protein
MAEIEGRPGLDDLVLRVDKPLESRLLYRDDDGKDYDVLDMRDALIAIRANTAPTAVSLSLPNRIRAIYQIACQALPDG